MEAALRRGWGGALRLAHRGSASFLSVAQRQQVVDWLHQQERTSVPEVATYIEQHFQFRFRSEQSYYTLLNQARFAWKKSQAQNPKADPDQVEAKRVEIKKKLAEWRSAIKAGQISAFFIDECHLLWGDAYDYIWGPTAQRVEIPIENSRRRQAIMGPSIYSRANFTCGPMSGPMATLPSPFYAIYYDTIPTNNWSSSGMEPPTIDMAK